ncbi:MAG: class I SAM-dependent methyltransferase [Anaerolineae bacterium]
MICDYEGSDYKTRFWQNADRAYEDAAERVALRRLLPMRGRRIVEFGAGFGRLADLYSGYDQVVLLDYSRTMLEQAMQRWGNDPRFIFVAADVYHLPFADGVFDAATMIRVIHHIAKVPEALAGIQRVVAPAGVFVLEFANKRHIKSVARYLLRRQEWNPFDLHPFEFVKLNFDFHPAWMLDQLRRAGFVTRRRLSVSYLRAGFIKRRVPVQWMVYADALLQYTGAFGLWSPSVFTQNYPTSGRQSPADGLSLAGDAIFRSPRSGQPLRRDGDLLVCDADGTRWRTQGNFYDFKENV